MKKVLYVITKANWGGAQRYVYDLATQVPKSRYEVCVAFGTPGLLKERLTKAGVPICELPSLARDVALLADVRSFFALLHLFTKERPDIVHLNSSKAAGLGALAARLAGVPRVVFTVHGWPFLETRSFLPRSCIYFLSWLTALLSHTIIVVSKHDLALAKRMLFIKHTVHHIYNGIDVNMALFPADSIRNSFPKNVHITGTIGELTRNKNQIALVEQARNNPSMYVAIVGDGEDRSYLEKKIHEYGLNSRVKIFGFQWAEHVLRGFDVFALPSLKEGLPYVLLEAKAAGLPIEANRVGGVGEILDARDMSAFSLEEMMQKTIALY